MKKSPNAYLRVNYIVHSTSEDNENGVVSGIFDSPLSQKGRKQAEELYHKLRQAKVDFGQIYSSPLKRAKETALTLFPGQVIHEDPRLVEIDYGDWTHRSKETVDRERHRYINDPFPTGESYQDVYMRIKEFILEKKTGNMTVISHQAPQFAFEHICSGKSWSIILANDWRLFGLWQPFWSYSLKVPV
jgi:broad specificity phosphatase PhoE